MSDLGLFLLILVAVLSTAMSLWGLSRFRNYSSSPSSFESQQILLIKTCRLVSLCAFSALVLLAYAFLSDNFALHYVSSHSNSALPVFYKVAAVWGGHEGSMLFWVMTLAGWSAVISYQRCYPQSYQFKVLTLMNALVAMFAWFTLFTSNPFELNAVLPSEGRDLNPMLQDVALIFHPPLLYLGYVGYSTVLAFALAALWEKEIPSQWVEWCQPWAMGAWLFLTLGIGLGSWWAYYELGWGGWWFWDPVENASLLPWLTGTALCHTLLANRYHGVLQRWCYVLALVTFSLSIIGTFIVRSGVLTSVHAFAVDPDKGIALLAILALVLLVGLGSFVLRLDEIRSAPLTHWWSASFLMLIATGLLAIAAFTVGMGTFYPMLYTLFGFGSISVGAPYFNAMILPFVFLGMLALGAVPLIKHKNRRPIALGLALLSTLLGTTLYRLQVDNPVLWVQLFWILGCWVASTHLLCLLEKKTRAIPMLMAHLGLAFLAVGTAMNAEHSLEIAKKMAPGDTLTFMQWQVTYEDMDWAIGPNYTLEKARFTWQKEGASSFIMEPERRHYPVRVMNMSEPALHGLWNGDLYVTLGSKFSEQSHSAKSYAVKSYAVKLQFKAYIGWIWLAALMFVMGSVLALVSRWKERRVQSVESQRYTLA
ncbi:cytochrome C [Vibrio metoecus]|uniref:heme lyase CcmF/NrfE family subunit n=1 Tax=Vibrio metoecus TaxID=1481663 RepID=UPI000BA922CF|nr:heme lyase CcmF/NrfE family subunit [Vibrio metoecus]PAR39590.1 cytochrome C [Vibrio metoecus]